jgi:heptaprenyl diphosphate synthase
MALLVSIPRNPFSPFGISIFGAVSHNLAQLMIAALLFIGLREILFLYPVFISISLVTGSITGFIALLVLRPLSQVEVS